MAAEIMDGKALAAKVRGEVKERNEAFQARFGRPAGLAVVRVGEDPASAVYVRTKHRMAKEAGLLAEEHHLDADATQEAVLAKVAELNAREDVDAILVQLPLPAHIHTDTVIAAVDPAKDADGFHPFNVGLLASGRKGPRACTPVGCMRLLDEAGVVLAGAEAVVVGRSNIVGKPMALLLLERGCTVTICHSKTKDLAEVVGRADVVVAAVGRAGLVKGEWIKPGAAVLDVGINRLPDGKLVGDVAFDTAKERAGHITPVPGGVGPMTVAMLLSNAVDLALARMGG